jgi:replicative DNA helicase
MERLDLDFFENVIMYRSLTDTSYLTSIVDFLKPEYFKNNGISSIFEIIKNFYDKRQELPTNTEIKSYLINDSMKRSFKDLVVSFKSLDKNINNDELYENTERFLKERAIYHTMLEVAEDVVKGDVDTGVALTKFESACNINLVTDTGLEIFGDVERIVEDLLNVDKTIPSLWEWYDEVLGGGYLENGRALYMFAGESNIGKSIVLGNVAANIAEQGKNVLVITLEMPETLYAQRIISNITKIPMNLLSADIPTLRHSINQKGKDTNGKIYIKEFPPSTITPNQLKSFVQKMIDSGIEIDAIVLDYLNLLHSDTRDNSYERIKDVAEQVRAMTYVFNCPIISATQLNREGFDTDNPNMVTISESIGLAATSDVITSIFQSEEDREMGILRYGMMKNRFGIRGGTQAMRIDYNTLSITQADDIDELDGDDESLGALMGIVDN